MEVTIIEIKGIEAARKFDEAKGMNLLRLG